VLEFDKPPPAPPAEGAANVPEGDAGEPVALQLTPDWVIKSQPIARLLFVDVDA
jgi:hypothetical protein